jgi:hypothetical protein
VYAAVPSRSLFAGDVFDMEVRSRFNVYLKTVEVQIKVGDGLEIVFDGNYPMPAMQNNGESVFEQAQIDGDATKAYAVLAGRKDGKKPESEAGSEATNELLFTLRVKVKSGVEDEAESTVEITKLEGVTDLKESQLDIKAVGILDGRAGRVKDEPITVHFATDNVMGIFAYTEGHTELLNFPIISGEAIEIPVKAKAVRVKGGTEDVDAECKTLNAAALGVDDACVAVLDGTETEGAPLAAIEVTAVNFTRKVPFRIHHLVKDSLQMKVSLTTLRPIEGWYQDDCETLMYQEGTLTVMANFSDGSDAGLFENVDVTTISTFASSNESVALVRVEGAGSWVTGLSPGDATISITGASGDELISEDVTIATQTNIVQLGGLDAVVLGSLGKIEFGGKSPYSRGSTFDVIIGPPTTEKLEYEDDETHVVVSAVFTDDTRLELTAKKGLVLTSFNEDVITVSGQTLVVPFNPTAGSGELVEVHWNPDGACQEISKLTIAKQNVTIEVNPPKATGMELAVSQEYIVCAGDLATKDGAGYASTAQLSGKLKFPEGVVKKNIQTDNRTKYEVPAGAPFTVDGDGKINANNKGKVGEANVTVTFDGQDVTETILIIVTKYESLEVTASPEPAYSGSADVDASTLSPIACTDPTLYQQAKLRVRMVLENGQTKDLAAGVTTFNIVVTDGDDDILVEVARVLTAGGVGTVEITASFANTAAATALDVTITDTPVTIKSLDGILLSKGGKTITTLSGEKGKQKAQIKVGCTLSDDRQYPALFDENGTPKLPGVLSFASGTDDKASVDVKRGTVTLLDNHPTAVQFAATACTDDDARKVEVVHSTFCNLHPVTVGDADLGSGTGPPIGTLKKGNDYVIPVRVNTGGKKLQFFNIQVEFDKNTLELKSVAHTIASANGLVQFKAALGESEDVVIVVGTISNSKVVGGTAGVSIFQMKFSTKGKNAGTAMSGTVIQLLDNTLGDPQPIGEGNVAFEAGDVTVIVTAGRRNRRRMRPTDVHTLEFAALDDLAGVPSKLLPAALDGTVEEEASATTNIWEPMWFEPSRAQEQRTGSQTATSRRAYTASRRRRGDLVEGKDLPALKGDANCDGTFDGKDPVFVLNFIAARGNSFTTPLGKIIDADLKECRADRDLTITDVAFMDADGSTEVTTLDLVYMLDILAGNFYFMSVHVTPATADYCKFTIDVVLANDAGKTPRKGTRVLLDLTYTEIDLAPDKTKGRHGLRRGLRQSELLITEEKGSSKMFGGLVKMVAGDAGVFSFTMEGAGELVTFADVGVSVIQIAPQKVVSGTQWKFFGGPTTDFFYTEALLYPATALETAFPIDFPKGYNPFRTEVSSTVPDECKDDSFGLTTTSSIEPTTTTTHTNTTTTVTTTTLTTTTFTNTSTTSTTTTTGTNTSSTLTITSTTVSNTSTTFTSTTSTTGTVTTTTDTSTSTTASTRNTSNVTDVDDLDASLGLAIDWVVGIACMVMFCWIVSVVVIIRYRKHHLRETIVKEMMGGPATAGAGDVMFDDPGGFHPLSIQAQLAGDGLGGGGFVDSETGDVVMHHEADEYLTMKDGQAFNPLDGLPTDMAETDMDALLGTTIEYNAMGGDDDLSDSLGDLSDFDDADFEEFADSLLMDSNMGDNADLFGYARAPASIGNAAGAGQTLLDRINAYESDDDLSDFENDSGDESISEINLGRGGMQRPIKTAGGADGADWVTTQAEATLRRPAKKGVTFNTGGHYDNNEVFDDASGTNYSNSEFGDVKQLKQLAGNLRRSTQAQQAAAIDMETGDVGGSGMRHRSYGETPPLSPADFTSSSPGGMFPGRNVEDGISRDGTSMSSFDIDAYITTHATTASAVFHDPVQTSPVAVSQATRFVSSQGL